MKCIYCVENKPLSSFTKIEHVMPQSFGLFRNNFSLVGTVCDDCNQYFGDNLEIVMARDTLEGTSRFEFELKSAKEFKSLGKRSRIMVKFAEGEFKGAYAYREYSKVQDRIVIKLVPQIGFLKKGSAAYEYYLLDQIPPIDYLHENKFDMKNSRAIRAFGIDVDTARKVLSEKGIKFEYQGEAGPSGYLKEDWLCQIEASIDSTVFRTVAKIAFNYLAYWAGKDFLIDPSFNPCRNFIRYDRKAAYPFVLVDDTPIMGDEPVEGIRRLGHIITVNWATDRISIVSQVSLFNLVSYRVSLARDFSGEQRNLRRGHFFNVNNGEIHELEAMSIS